MHGAMSLKKNVLLIKYGDLGAGWMIQGSSPGKRGKKFSTQKRSDQF